MSSLTILNVIGCRPNFIKIAPLMKQMNRCPEICPVLVHTGQHYDETMSDVFFRDLEIPPADIYLGIGSGTYAAQTAEIMRCLEPILTDTAPDLVVVVGDVNSTIAAALASIAQGIPVAHVEAGLRSFDREMPEEINRLLTDAVSEFLFATEESAVANLLREGKSPEQIFLVGNVMIDTLIEHLATIDRSGALARFELVPRGYALVTMHRASNVDDPDSLRDIVSALAALQCHIPLVFPVHPRTAARLDQFHRWRELLSLPNLHPIEPLGYIDFLKLMKESAFVLTDSGGMQEETTALGVPCLTMRENTERPITLTLGTNQLVGTSPERIVERAVDVLHGMCPKGKRPENWDGHASERITAVLLDHTEKIKGLYHNVRKRSVCMSTFNPASLHRV